MKYIRSNINGILIFSIFSSHKGVANKLEFKDIISAGFIGFQGTQPYCYGYSQSLNLKSLEEDTIILRRQFEKAGFVEE